MPSKTHAASRLDAQRFKRDGYVVVSGLVDAERRAALREAVAATMAPLLGPVEFEADVLKGRPYSSNLG